MSGSRGNLQNSATVRFKCHGVEEDRRFDVINIDGYDVILGTPFLFQHEAIVGFNPTRFTCGSRDALPIQGDQVSVVSSVAAEILKGELEDLRAMLLEEAADLCKSAEDSSAAFPGSECESYNPAY